MDDARFDRDTFLATMANVAASVTVVTTFTESREPRGLTVSAFASVSLDPPLVLVCIGNESSAIPALRTHGGFTLNFLARGTEAIALQMAERDDDKFDGVGYQEPTTREAGPVLTDVAFAFFECEMHAQIGAGDHWVFIGRVVEGALLDDREPLVYHRRSFVDLAD